MFYFFEAYTIALCIFKSWHGHNSVKDRLNPDLKTLKFFTLVGESYL